MISIYNYNQLDNKEILARMSPKANVEDIVSAIIENVKTNGDKALYEYTEKFDGAKLESLEVSDRECAEAMQEVEATILFRGITAHCSDRG